MVLPDPALCKHTPVTLLPSYSDIASPLAVYTEHELQTASLVFAPSVPAHGRGTVPKQALRGPFSSCHLK